MSSVIDKVTILKYDVAGPRYTSYPTAPQWTHQVNSSTYQQKLKLFGLNDKTLSLYVHIPFCEQLCYFCACNKVIRPKEVGVGDEFLDHLINELEGVARAIGSRKTIKQLHWGGGTPTFLSERQSQRLMMKITDLFDVDLNGEIAIEIDPRTVTQDKLEILAVLGFNRISMGVQDFDAKVQDDINRIQPFEQVVEVNDWCRQLRFLSVNFDLVYGLPYQTKETFANTVMKVIGLKPDRIALYSFAYVPWISKPQNKFNLEAIPLHDEKLDIFINSRDALLNAGYKAIAMDHFALSTDDMAKAFDQGKLHRNFMGYTVKPADEFIGVGPSAIGFLENTYFQNIKVLPEYYETVSKGNFPIERGQELSQDDIIRKWVINAFMCAFLLNKDDFYRMFQKEFDVYFDVEKDHIKNCVEDGLLQVQDRVLQVTDLGKIFIRNIAMGFDWYLRQKDSHKRFSRTI